MSREIPTLFITLLKFIAKQPGICLTPAAVRKSGEAIRKSEDSEVDICQLVVKYVAESGRYTDEAIPPFFFTNRRVLSLRNTKISGKYIREVLDNCCSTLQSLDVCGCFQVDDAVLIDILTRCNQLKYLDIENCRKISDKGVDGLVGSKRKLDSINIGGDYNITNTGLKRFFTGFSNLRYLRHLHVSGLDINDDIIYAIVDSCSDLESLSISFADISEDALNTLLDRFGEQLRHLNISWLNQVPAAKHSPMSGHAMADMIFNKCPRLTELDLSGTKTLHAVNVMQLLDAKTQQIISGVSGCEPLTLLRVKFISTPKTTLEAQIVSGNYSDLTLIA